MIHTGRGESDWIVAKEKYKYDEIFESLKNSEDKVAGATAKAEMVKSKLPNTVLAKVLLNHSNSCVLACTYV